MCYFATTGHAIWEGGQLLSLCCHYCCCCYVVYLRGKREACCNVLLLSLLWLAVAVSFSIHLWRRARLFPCATAGVAVVAVAALLVYLCCSTRSRITRMLQVLGEGWFEGLQHLCGACYQHSCYYFSSTRWASAPETL